MSQSNVLIPAVLATFFIASLCQGLPPTAEDHGSAELTVEGPVLAPISHGDGFELEKDLFGYNPRYLPRAVTFDADNRPHMSGGWYIQTLSDDGQWVPLNVSKALGEVYGDLGQDTVSFGDDHVGFDSDGDMYVIGRTRLRHFHKIYRHGLLHSQDKGKTWRWYDTHVPVSRLERPEAHNQITGPPPMVEGFGRELNLVVSYKKPDGTLTPPKRILVAGVEPPVVGKGRHWLTPAHSGCGNVTATFEGKTHVVWQSIQPLTAEQTAEAAEFTATYGDEGLCPCYIATYDHKTGELSESTYLGLTRRDNHNGPVISVDSKGYLHVIIGAHHANFFYRRSLSPNSSTEGWTEAEVLGVIRPKKGGGAYSYTAFLCDQEDNLHLVSRWAGSGYYFRLVYQRKKAGQEWEPHKTLVTPFRSGYCAWQQKINIDRLGRLFLNYAYFPAADLTKAQKEAYAKKWPEDVTTTGTLSIRPHGHTMLISEDSGDTWRLAVTDDFVNGMKLMETH